MNEKRFTIVIVIIICCVLAAAFFSAYATAKEKSEFMKDCTAEHAKYYCVALWRKGARP